MRKEAKAATSSGEAAGGQAAVNNWRTWPWPACLPPSWPVWRPPPLPPLVGMSTTPWSTSSPVRPASAGPAAGLRYSWPVGVVGCPFRGEMR